MACRSLVHWASRNEKLLAQKQNLLVPDDQTALFSSPVDACQAGTYSLASWCLRDNNYVLLFYCVCLSGQLGLSNLGISGNKSVKTRINSS